MKTIALGIAFMTASCGAHENLIPNTAGYSKACIDGVSYLVFENAVTVQYDAYGNVKTCKS